MTSDNVNWVKYLAQDDRSLAEAISEHAQAIGVRYPLMERALFSTLAPYENENNAALMLTSPRTGMVWPRDNPMATHSWWVTRVADIWREAHFRAWSYVILPKKGGDTYER